MQDILDELESRRARALLGGGEKRIVGRSTFELYAKNETDRELSALSDWLDENPDLPE